MTSMRKKAGAINQGRITDVPGIKVGNKEDLDALTGCTVILAEEGATAGVDVRGSAPGTRETDLLNPINYVEKVHAIVLSGGSAFGLDAASGVMQYLEERDIGLNVGQAKVPIVPAAVLFDLAVGNGKVRPDKQMGYEAAQSASSQTFKIGNVGAGCGATVGKLAGFDQSMKGGLGSASIQLENGVTIGAIVAVNPVGEVRNPGTGEILAGAYDRNQRKIMDSLEILENQLSLKVAAGGNTTIGVIAVNANLTKAEVTKVAQMAHDGYARTIYPAHTMLDGDTIFALATGGKKLPVDLLGTMAAKVMEMAILNAIYSAETVANIPAHRDLFK
ncbi:L-aminopeptidase/D-esterase-like protein [Bacillus oleivorans]|uniref:L-aminopeptidase/D-esterase-like protein n=1 Tax=Bacillus oleivorans TaxID=1448271 RepID=A0A285CYD9_9BACI|nr:P1 family peptidase [Bacillus oleivorans]SNX72561.1 L-aminopeptidase/D-esterase-like protein [Bacillus oleivorans]